MTDFMKNSGDSEKWLNEKFEYMIKSSNTLMNAHMLTIGEQLQGVKEDLNEIKLQVKTTNGRVNKLESDGLLHPLNCPQVKKIEDLEKGLADAMFFQRHPKLGVGILGVFIFTMIVSIYTFWESSRKIIQTNKVNTEQIITSDSINERFYIKNISI